MTTIVLPDELPIEKLQFVQVYDYNTKQEITKQQIILNQILLVSLQKEQRSFL
jgi:hypothetical protein